MSTTLFKSIKDLTDLMFFNLKIAMKTCDWQADICGAPAWRYIYHTIHSCDKWFINPSVFEEPSFHAQGLDWPDNPFDIILSEEQLYGYYEKVREKVLAFLDTMKDDQLGENPEGWHQSRLGLVLGQFRHMYAHIGILNGVTIAHTQRYPRVVNFENWRKQNLPENLFDE